MPSWIRLAVLALSFSVSACGTARTPATPATVPAPTSSIRFERVEIGGGLALHIQCEGRERPVVVLDSGLGEGVEAWSLVQRHVAAFARVCAYDRAGHGRSDSFRFPHGNRQMARELFALLEKSGELGPYVLVGHSMGGTNVQLLLEEHPESVAGMVLLDSSPEPAPIERMPPGVVADFEQNLKRLEGLDVKTWLAGFEELRASKRSLGDKPLLILVAGKPQQDPSFTPAQAQELLAARQREQQPLVSLSSNAAFVTVPESGHHLPREAPEVVVQAVYAAVRSARTGERDLAKFSRTVP
jgi:pimeloyl-ACP methyl ester carboxylesterase